MLNGNCEELRTKLKGALLSLISSAIPDTEILSDDFNLEFADLLTSYLIEWIQAPDEKRTQISEQWAKKMAEWEKTH